jgi:hypothetical protein
MGNPISIIKLAQRMLELYWKNPTKSIGVEFFGMRPVEKLKESLVYSYEEMGPHFPFHGAACFCEDRLDRRPQLRRRNCPTYRCDLRPCKCGPDYREIEEARIAAHSRDR